LLDSGVYRTFNNVLVRAVNGSTQIDHVIVSKYGLFVVETKNKSGYIYGSQNNEYWTQVFLYGKKKLRFQNPLRQNYKHTKSLAEFLGIDHSKIHSLVVFWGDCEFRTEMPENVIRGTHTGYIKSKKQVIFSEDEVSEICVKLKALKDSTPILAGWHHTRDLKKRFESTTTCPRCGVVPCFSANHAMVKVRRSHSWAARSSRGVITQRKFNDLLGQQRALAARPIDMH